MSNNSKSDEEVYLGFADSERELDYEVDFPTDADGKIGGKPVILIDPSMNVYFVLFF